MLAQNSESICLNTSNGKTPCLHSDACGFAHCLTTKGSTHRFRRGVLRICNWVARLIYESHMWNKNTVLVVRQTMDDINCCIVPTQAQITALAGPRTIHSLLAADFLGYQDYIDSWINDWTQRNDVNPLTLPLCVSESIICHKKVRKHYHRYVKAAVVSNDYEWLLTHYIVPYARVWSYVRFETVPIGTFSLLWDAGPCQLNMAEFVCSVHRLDIWRLFVQHHGPTLCLRTVLRNGWIQGARYCLSAGADVTAEDFIIDCIRLDPRLFRAIAECNPPATLAGYREFKLQRSLHRIPDVPLVEEYFWIHGFKDTV